MFPIIIGHIFHFITGEKSSFRRFFLDLYIRYEVGFLRLVLAVIESPVGKTRLCSRLIWWTFGKWLKKWGETGHPMSPEEVDLFFSNLPTEYEIAIGNCRCKTARAKPCRRFYEKKCAHPMETEITVRLGTKYYMDGYPGEYRIISKEKAVERINSLWKMGHAPHIFYFCVAGGLAGKEFVICNCCKGACVPIEVNRRGMPIVMHGTARASIDYGLCRSCFNCMEMCLYDAIGKNADGKPFITKCHGCGVCAYTCPSGAIKVMAPGQNPNSPAPPRTRSADPAPGNKDCRP